MKSKLRKLLDFSIKKEYLTPALRVVVFSRNNVSSCKTVTGLSEFLDPHFINRAPDISSNKDGRRKFHKNSPYQCGAAIATSWETPESLNKDTSTPGDFPGGVSGKEPTCQCRRPKRLRFALSLIGEIPWRKAWQPTPVFLPGESHSQRRLAGHGVAKRQTQLKQLSTRAPEYTDSHCWGVRCNWLGVF